MTRIYLIRHAEAEGNLYRRAHGTYNSLLTALGYRQALELSKRFRDVEIDAVYSSDLVRTCLTALPLCKSCGLELYTTSALREVSLGVWEDKTWGEIMRKEPQQYNYFSMNPFAWHVECCEPFCDVQHRMEEAIREIAKLHDGKTVIVFSHGSAIRTFSAAVQKVSVEEIRHVDNTAVSLYEFEKGLFSQIYYGDISHLPENCSTLKRQQWWRNKAGIDNSVMYFETMDLDDRKEAKWYLRCYKNAWISAHGTENGFCDTYLTSARKHQKDFPGSVLKAVCCGENIGIIELAVKKNAEKMTGCIAFCYLEPDYRGKGLAGQLIGQAISVYRKLGREKLSLNVAEENKRAIKFYTANGFTQVSTDRGALGTLLVMEKDISIPNILCTPVVL